MAVDENKIKSKSKTKGKILLVDDDKFILKYMVNILSKVYEIKTAMDGTDALEILKNGYRPGVIISDQIMPQMNGSEMLAKSVNYVPNAARIVITATTDSKEIIRSINESKALMYITKPFEKLDLIQAALIGFDHYKNKLKVFESSKKSQIQIEELTKTLRDAETMQHELKVKLTEAENIKTAIDQKLESANRINDELREEVGLMKSEIRTLYKRNEDLASTIASLELFPNQSIQAITELIKDNEKHYFTKHTDNVVEIVRDVASEFQMEPEKLKALMMAAVLHNVSLLGMPDRLKLNDPMNMDEKVRAQYFKFFNKAIDRLENIDLLKDHSEIISQIWEHRDGSGYPRGLYEDQISFESQILSLAVIYHNAVYRLTHEQYKVLMQAGEIEQPFNETQERHKEIMTQLYKWTKWFDYDVLRIFQEKVKHKEIRAAVPQNKTLSISFKDNSDSTEEIDYSKIISFGSGEENLIHKIEKEVVATYEEREMHPYKLKPGMISMDTIRTINGVEAVSSETVLEPTHLKKLKQLFISEMIPNKLMVKVPVYK
jgi:response regulator RpfG family c-di-GMP phosphodiesterase